MFFCIPGFVEILIRKAVADDLSPRIYVNFCIYSYHVQLHALRELLDVCSVLIMTRPDWLVILDIIMADIVTALLCSVGSRYGSSY